MTRVSELLSKQLICLQDARIVGTFSNILLDEKLQKCLLLKVYCENEEDAQTKYVRIGDVKCSEGDAAVILSPASVLSEWETPTLGNNPINSIAYNQDGKQLGRVSDVVLEGARVSALVIGEKEFTPDKVLSHSESLVILNDSGKPVRFAKPAFKAAEGMPAASVHAAPPPPALPQEKAPQEKPPSSDKVILPITLTSGPAPSGPELAKYDFLLNKTVQKNLFADDGVQIAKQGDVIDFAIISSAKQKGKLVQLAISVV